MKNLRKYTEAIKMWQNKMYAKLFLSFLEDYMLTQFWTVFLEFNLALNFLSILTSKIHLSGGLISDLYQMVL